MQNIRKWIQITYLVLAAVVWFFFFNLTELVCDLASIPLPADWFLSPSQIIAFVTAAATLVILNKHVKINEFSVEVASELSKVTWPERKETIMSTGVIAVMVAICALLLFGFDSLWGTVIKIIYL